MIHQDTDPRWLDFCHPSLMRPLPQPDLLSLLRSLDEDELEGVAWRLQAGGVQVSGSEPEKMVEAVLTAVEGNLLLLSAEALELLSAAAASPGPLNIDLETYEDLLFMLRQQGLLFVGTVEPKRPAVVLPTEIRARWGDYIQGTALREQAEHNQQLLQNCRGVLDYYGLLSLDELYEVISRLGVAVERAFFQCLINLTGNDGLYVQAEDGCVWHPLVDDTSWLAQELSARPKLERRPLALADVRSAPDAFVSLPAYEEFGRFLSGIGVSTSEVSYIQAYVLNGFQNQDPFLQSGLEELIQGDEHVSGWSVAEVDQYLEAMRDQTPLWMLKGYSPAEIRRLGIDVSTEALITPSEDDEHAEYADTYIESDALDSWLLDDEGERPRQPHVRAAKVGRNDPCPCGSGKKYKKCCGSGV